MTVEFEDDKEQFDDSEVITLQEAQERGLDLSMFNLKSK